MAIFLRLPEVCRRTSLSTNSIYRLSATGDFPHPVKISSRASAWVEEEVDAWIEKRIRDSRGDETANAIEIEADREWL